MIQLLRSLGPELTGEVFGIVVTVLVLQRVVDRRERRARLLRSVGGIRRAGESLRAIVRGWSQVLAPVAQALSTTPRSLHALFSSEVAALLERPGGFDQTIAHNLESAGFDDARARLRRVPEVYGALLDPSYAETLEALADDPFWESVREVARSIPEARPAYMKAIRERREAFFRRLLRAVELQNALGRELAAARAPGNRPRTGSLGLALDGDSDLRVPVILPRRRPADPRRENVHGRASRSQEIR